MYQQNNTQQLKSESLLTIRNIIVAITITALVVGSGIYWWQKSIAEREKEKAAKNIKELKQQISSLQSKFQPIAKEFKSTQEKINKELKQQINSLQTNIRTLNIDFKNIKGKVFDQSKNKIRLLKRVSFLEDKVAKQIIANRANEIVLAIKNKDMVKLSTFIHPNKGVRFSPSVYVEVKTALIFSATQIRNLLSEKTKYIWGVNEAGTIKLTFSEYFNRFIYDRDYVNAKNISYSGVGFCGPIGYNLREIYPEAIFVGYQSPKFVVSPEFNCKHLGLVFEEKNDIWYLVGIVHGDHEI